jgi:hypothetical protein
MLISLSCPYKYQLAIMKIDWIAVLGGGILGTLLGGIVASLVQGGIESSSAFNLISSFILFPEILLLSLPWSLLVPNSTGNAFTAFGLAIGFMLNCGLSGMFFGWRMSVRAQRARKKRQAMTANLPLDTDA